MKKLLLFLAISLSALAQTTMVGLPQHGVTLTGNNVVPVIQNHSGKGILGFSIKFLEEGAPRQNVGPNADVLLLMNPIPDGGEYTTFGAGVKASIENSSPVAGHVPNGPIAGTQFPVTKVILDGILFTNGTFVGPDKEGLSDRMGLKVKIASTMGSQVVNGTMTWDQVRAAAAVQPTAHTTQEFQTMDTAQRLIQVYDVNGESAALNLAAKFAAFPTTIKKQ